MKLRQNDPHVTGFPQDRSLFLLRDGAQQFQLPPQLAGTLQAVRHNPSPVATILKSVRGLRRTWADIPLCLDIQDARFGYSLLMIGGHSDDPFPKQRHDVSADFSGQEDSEHISLKSLKAMP